MAMHNHPTRDVKQCGSCPGCYEHHERQAGPGAAAFAGALSAMHENLGRLQANLGPDDANDIDNARVYLEAAFRKLQTSSSVSRATDMAFAGKRASLDE